ncbi:MAG: YraN family protein [Clostridia bacterium]|nr:YraN family protein [Clostridia bacterium]
MKQNNKKLGGFGEREAARYLRKKGYQRVAANYSCQYGEVDLIVQKPGILVFAEVKTRQSRDFGAPAEAVGFRKQEKIKLVAQEFLLSYDEDVDVRFDVVEVMAEPSLFGGYRVREINHIEQAF